jgi:hypothetical protein
MYCTECGKKCEELQQAGPIWYYHCQDDGYFGYNGYVEPAVYVCYGDVDPLGFEDSDDSDDDGDAPEASIE